MEQLLREGRASTSLDAARALAGALAEQGLAEELRVHAASANDIYVHRLPVPIQVDGYSEDWRTLGVGNETLARRKTPLTGESPTDTFGASLAAGVHDGSLYVLVEVVDPDIVYALAPTLGRGESDHLLLTLADEDTRSIHVIDTLSPGWARPTEVRKDQAGLHPIRRTYRITAEWREQPKGYAVELRLPFALASQGLQLDVIDIKSKDLVGMRSIVSSARSVRSPLPPEHIVVNEGLGRPVLSSTRIDAALNMIGAAAGRRVWVVDQEVRIRGRAGSLLTPETPNPIHPVFRWLLTPSKIDESRNLGGGRLNYPVVLRALEGRESAHWEASGYADAAKITAAHAVISDGEVIGAVVVEENAAPIQTVRRQALAELVVQTLTAACLAAGVLIWFTSRVGKRLQKLRDDTNQAINRQGRVVGSIAPIRAGDEIGELGVAMSDMLERLRRYNDYLEQLAHRLSHELRTPIAVIRSSLENLEQAPHEEADRYAERAKGGLVRLNTILSRMSEATRIEESLSIERHERFDLAEIVCAATESYTHVWPGVDFVFIGNTDRDILIEGVADLVVQALDKLVENAVEFGKQGENIALRVGTDGVSAWVEVDNVGPPLPQLLGDRIFDSLVSERTPSRNSDVSPHLGLGLHIVRLIAEFHGGSTQAFPRPDQRGVIIRLVVPLAD